MAGHQLIQGQTKHFIWDLRALPPLLSGNFIRGHTSILYLLLTAEKMQDFLINICLFVFTDAISYTFHHYPLVLDWMQLSFSPSSLLNKYLISCFTGSMSRGKEPQVRREFSVPHRTMDGQKLSCRLG